MTSIAKDTVEIYEFFEKDARGKKSESYRFVTEYSYNRLKEQIQKKDNELTFMKNFVKRTHSRYMELLSKKVRSKSEEYEMDMLKNDLMMASLEFAK